MCSRDKVGFLMLTTWIDSMSAQSPLLRVFSQIYKRKFRIKNVLPIPISDHQGPEFDDMSSLFPCEIDDAIQYINLEFSSFCVVFKF